MSYYPTLQEDVDQAKAILAKGRWETNDPFYQALQTEIASGTIYGADIYAAYKLLESFVEVIEAVDPKVCELALRQVRLAERRGRGR